MRDNYVVSLLVMTKAMVVQSSVILKHAQLIINTRNLIKKLKRYPEGNKGLMAEEIKWITQPRNHS